MSGGWAVRGRGGGGGGGWVGGGGGGWGGVIGVGGVGVGGGGGGSGWRGKFRRRPVPGKLRSSLRGQFRRTGLRGWRGRGGFCREWRRCRGSRRGRGRRHCSARDRGRPALPGDGGWR